MDSDGSANPFVRENSQLSVEEKNQSDDHPQSKKDIEKSKAPKNIVGTDIQAILTIIGRREKTNREPERINLLFT